MTVKPQAPSFELLLDHRALRAIDLDLLGRTPFSAEVRAWIGRPVSEHIDSILASREFWDRWYEEQLYYFLLVNNFRPETEKSAAIPADLHSGAIDVREAIHRIALTSSFDQRNPGADTFVTVVLEQLTGLQVQKAQRDLEIGKKMYDGTEGSLFGQRGRTQADVVRIAVDSRAFSSHFLSREHERIVGSRCDSRELSAWATRFQADPACFPELVRAWVSSDSYRARLEHRRAVPNRLFVRALFVDLFDRVPTAAESEPLREALDSLADSAPLRSIAVRLLVDSGRLAFPAAKDIPDPAAWVRVQFLRFLGRPPSETEIRTFTEALAQPGCRTQTVIQALLTSPEYP